MDNFLNSFTEQFPIFGNGGPGGFGGFGGDRDREDRFPFFQNAAAFHREAMDPQGGSGNGGAPPASSKALRQLPTVIVSPEDLVDESNRECCICLEENNIGDRVIRLPCAHIFHEKCIVDWLNQHCTCPVCRYELETDNPRYERGRKARMRSRKPRIHRYVLERMSIQELKKLAKDLKVSWPRKIREKEDILEAFTKSGKIEIIAAPKPVEYKIEELRAMKISKLRNAMAEAGVFFNPRDVVEKEDMVRIFCNSGRLILLSESSEDNINDKKPAAKLHYKSPKPPMEPSMNLKSLQEELRSQPLNYDDDAMEIDDNLDEKVHAQHPTVETVEDYDEIHRSDSGNVTPMFEDFSQKLYNSTGVVEEENNSISHQRQHNQYSPQHSTSDEMIGGDENLSEKDKKIAEDYKMFESYKISDLRDAAFSLNVDLSSCIERSEMVDKLVQARNGILWKPEDFNRWSVSDLRAIATAVGVDLSNSIDRSAMIQQLVKKSKLHAHVSNYLSSLMPLAKLSVTEIRALAREWRVDVSDCIEKEEMIHRLVASTTPSSYT